MTPASADPLAAARQTWSVKDPHVQKALKWIRRRGTVNTEDIVDWDARNGRKLFTWDNDLAATLRRRDEAIRFYNHFSKVVDGCRVKWLQSMPDPQEPRKRIWLETAKADRVEGFRDYVIEKIQRKIESASVELRLWQLTPEERAKIVAKFERDILG